LSSLLFLCCKEKTSIELDQINGYWQIEFVQQGDEIFKSKKFNRLYDFYSTKKNKGIYKKVANEINGIFQTSESVISFEIIKDDGEIILHFFSPWNSWIKKIKYLDSKKLVLFHGDRSFHYIKPNISKINLGNE